jgi:hypothetical protein
MQYYKESVIDRPMCQIICLPALLVTETQLVFSYRLHIQAKNLKNGFYVKIKELLIKTHNQCGFLSLQ